MKKLKCLIKSFFKYSIEYTLNAVNHFSIKNKWNYEIIFRLVANSLRVCDSLRIRQTNDIFFQICCSFAMNVVCSSNSNYVDSKLNDSYFFCRCLCFRFFIKLNLYEFIFQNAFHSKSLFRFKIFVRIHQKFCFDYK